MGNIVVAVALFITVTAVFVNILVVVQLSKTMDRLIGGIRELRADLRFDPRLFGVSPKGE